MFESHLVWSTPYSTLGLAILRQGLIYRSLTETVEITTLRLHLKVVSILAQRNYRQSIFRSLTRSSSGYLGKGWTLCLPNNFFSLASCILCKDRRVLSRTFPFCGSYDCPRRRSTIYSNRCWKPITTTRFMVQHSKSLLTSI